MECCLPSLSEDHLENDPAGDSAAPLKRGRTTDPARAQSKDPDDDRDESHGDRVTLSSYHALLAHLTASGRHPSAESNQEARLAADLPFFRHLPGLEQLYLSMPAVAAAVPGAHDEEWNPLSQRPHVPLPPTIGDEFGGEITARKEAVEAYTTMAHELMHVALWEPFFAGYWHPRSRKAFLAFSLAAEGYCFFYSDIVITGAVRIRLPDGEFALDRQTPSNARFAPARAFHALGLVDQDEILAIYLAGFTGERTALWQPRGANAMATALAAQVYDFYALSQGYLSGMDAALRTFGVFTEFRRRFCAIPGLPSFLPEETAQLAAASDPKQYFQAFDRTGLANLAALTPAQLSALQLRRQLQLRAYYALQIRWLVTDERIVAAGMTVALRRHLLTQVGIYLTGLHRLLVQLARQPSDLTPSALGALDVAYDENVRALFLAHSAWVGHRWLIAPRRAGGLISISAELPADPRAAKIMLLQVVAYLVDELSTRLRLSRTISTRTEVLSQMQTVAALGSEGGSVSASHARTRKAWRALTLVLATPEILELWSVPLASFDPVGNTYRELLFSYQ